MSAIVHLGAVRVESVWRMDGDCLAVQIVGLISPEQRKLLQQYRGSCRAIEIKLPKQSLRRFVMKGFDGPEELYFFVPEKSR